MKSRLQNGKDLYKISKYKTVLFWTRVGKTRPVVTSLSARLILQLLASRKQVKNFNTKKDDEAVDS
jgi:hypothetical protein